LNQKKILVLSIIATLFASVVFSAISFHFGLDIDTSPVALGQYGGGGRGGSSGSLPSAAAISAMTPQKAYNVLDDAGPARVAGVLEKVVNLKVIEIFKLYPDPLSIMEILQQMTGEKAGSLLLDMETAGLRPLTVEIFSLVATRHAGILAYMLYTDIPTSALLFEDSIKSLVEGLNETQKPQAVLKLAGALSLSSNDNLAELFREIAGFPETPSTVAYLVESMDVEVVLYAFNKWVDLGEYDLLVSILDHLSASTIGVIYRGMGGDYRLNLYPYLTENIISRLPEIGFFQVTQFNVNPLRVEPGSPVTIIFNLTNVGQQTDDYSIPVMINEETEVTYSGILEEGSSENYELNVTKYEEGRYTVNVDSESVSFTVALPPPVVTPATLEIENIQIIPGEVVQGTEMKVFVVVTNVGDEQGFETFELLIDHSIADFLTAQVPAGETKTIVFTFMADFDVGEHSVLVEEVVEDFIVLTAPVSRPWVTIIITVVVILSASVYYLYENDYLGKIIPSLSYQMLSRAQIGSTVIENNW